MRSDTQELRYNFRVIRNFDPDQFSSSAIFPRGVLYDPLLPGGRMLVVPDASGDFVYIRNLDDSTRPKGIQIQ